MVSENKVAKIFNLWIKILYELSTIEGVSPVYYHKLKVILSKIESVEFYRNKAKPFAKAKYYL